MHQLKLQRLGPITECELACSHFNNCWARTLCGVCYESSMEGGTDCPYVSDELCETSKELLKDMFVNYYRLYEYDKEKLDEAVKTINIM